MIAQGQPQFSVEDGEALVELIESLNNLLVGRPHAEENPQELNLSGELRYIPMNLEGLDGLVEALQRDVANELRFRNLSERSFNPL